MVSKWSQVRKSSVILKVCTGMSMCAQSSFSHSISSLNCLAEAVPGIELIFLAGHEGFWVGTKVGSNSSKYGVLSPKLFMKSLLCVCFILFYFHKMLAGRLNTQIVYNQQSIGSLPHLISMQCLLDLFCNQYTRNALNRNFLEEAVWYFAARPHLRREN